MRRRALLAASASEGGGGIFPIHIELTKIGNEYIHHPSPESIKLMDYFLENMQFNGWDHWEVLFPAGHLFIDNVEVSTMDIEGDESGPYLNSPYGSWSPRADYGYMMLPNYPFWLVDGEYPKGTIIVRDED